MKNKGFIGVLAVIVIATLASGAVYKISQNYQAEQEKILAQYKVDYNKLLLETYNLGAFRPSNYVGKLLTRLAEGGSETTFKTSPDEAADGTGLSTAKLGDFIVFTINPGGANEEKISVSAVATSSDKATWTVINRGLSFTENVAITANKKQHAIGETVIISNDDHYLSQQFVNIDDAQTVSGQKTFSQGILFSVAASSSVECVSDTQYCRKTYIDATANAGAATSTRTNGGILEIATKTEAASTTALVATKPLALITDMASSTPMTFTGSGNTYLIMSEDDGKLAQGWLDLTEATAWSGNNTHTGTETFGTATSTFNATTTLNDTIGLATSSPTFVDKINIGEDVYLAGGLGIGIATTTDNNLEVAGEALITGNLHVSGTIRGLDIIATTTAAVACPNGSVCTRSLSCPTGYNEMISGGFNIASTQRYPLQNYRSASTTWTVQLSSVADTPALTVYGLCIVN